MKENSKLILEIINASEEHLTAEQIYQRLRDRSSKMVMATVYNNLKALYEQGLIRKLVLEGQPDRYDRILRHDHLICRRCGRITDVRLGDLSSRLEEETGVQIEFYDLKIFYFCDQCKSLGKKG